jgi:hypothetical protein
MKKGTYIELKVIRTALRDTYTIGHLYVDGKYFCDTLEDKDRGLKNTMKINIITSHKVYGQTAIPVNALRGDSVYYDVILSHSPRFSSQAFYKSIGGRLPEVLGVPGFDGIRIHVGNRPEDTHGCLLVGKNTVKGMVTESKPTYLALMTRLLQAEKEGKKIVLNIGYKR